MLLSRPLKLGEFVLLDVTDVEDPRLVLESISLIRAGQIEGAFSCVPDLSLESVLDYRRTMKMRSSGLYGVYALIERGADVVGYIDFVAELGQGEILGVIVAPGYRRKGLGSALLRAAEHTLWEWGVSTIWVRIEESNEVSKRFFSRYGYIDSRIREKYVDRCGAARVEEVWWKWI